MNPAIAQNLWEVKFSESDGCTLVVITSTFEKLEDLEQTIEMGFKEGFTMGLNQLDTLLSSLKQ